MNRLEEVQRRDVVSAIFRFQSLFGLVAVFIAAVVFSPTRDGELVFLSSGNLFNILRDVSEIGIIAVGMTFVILIGGIDLSVGAVLGLTAVGSAVLLVEDDFSVLPAVVIVLLVGLGFGLLQGFASAVFGIPSFIVTLAGMQIARGLARKWSGGQGVAIAYGNDPGEAPVPFSLLGERTFNGTVPIPALIFVVVAAVAIVFLGFLAALAGIVHAGQLNQGSPNDGFGYELDAIAAVVVGGTSLAGGRGSVVGTVAGALLLGVLRNILRLHGVDSDFQLIISGLVIIVVAGLQRLRPAG